MANLILGLDPGSRRTGYGVVRWQGDDLTVVDYGIIDLPESLSLPQRLHLLSNQLEKLFSRHVITVTAVEKIFFGKNADSAFKLGHARGICLMAAARHGSAVEEYAARFVKKCVTGSGAASKDHVQKVVSALLSLRLQEAAFDATDALALAITHAREAGNRERIRLAMERTL